MTDDPTTEGEILDDDEDEIPIPDQLIAPPQIEIVDTVEIPHTDKFATTRRQYGERAVRYEDPGAVDGPWDRERRNPAAMATDVSCAVPWVREGYQVIELYLDPALNDRVDELCAVVTTLSTRARDLDALTEAVNGYFREEHLSPSFYEEPDDISSGVVAIAVTIG
jgi:hypothetical protein